MTYKLKQQIDVDDLFEREYFDFERSMETGVGVISCKIRGVRDPAKRRTATQVTASTQVRGPPPVDDGTKLVRITGCEYRLSESELLGWLSCFGDVLSEITEERFVTEGLDPSLPPIGNGTG